MKRQLKVWQHLKLSPHVASDFHCTDITFNDSVAAISISLGGIKESQENQGRMELLMAPDNHATFSNTCSSLSSYCWTALQRNARTISGGAVWAIMSPHLSQKQRGWGLSRQQLEAVTLKMGSRVGAGNLWPRQSLLRWEMSLRGRSGRGTGNEQPNVEFTLQLTARTKYTLFSCLC